MFLHFNSIAEEKPGRKWQGLFEKGWKAYRKWFLSEGYSARPGYLTCSTKMEQHMPEMFPLYNELAELAGGGDLEARFLSGYSPPPYMSGCSQIAWVKDRFSLIRNYDYDLLIFEGVMLKTNWLQPVIGMSDCLWGLLDGINAGGLSLSLTFGGRKLVGEGFGIPIVQRYILETCSSTEEAIAVLTRMPVHMAYNVTILDKSGHYSTVYLAPDRPAVVTQLPIGTNHQTHVEWEDYAKLTRTVERYEFLQRKLAQSTDNEDGMIRHFLHPPLYNTNYKKAFGTLYTAVYRPAELNLEIIWPAKKLTFSFDEFPEQKVVVNLMRPAKTKLSL